ncbi:MAG: hypothetical protein WCA77_02595, partial [Thermoplasmata archaeon]
MSKPLDTNSWRKIAAIALKRSLGLRRGQSVIIETWPHSLAIAEIIAVEARRNGIRATIIYVPEEAVFAAHGSLS